MVVDTVARTVYYKYFHPKEAFISNGVLNRCVTISGIDFPLESYVDNFLLFLREINKAAGKVIPGQGDQGSASMQ